MGRLLLLSMFFVASSIQAQECPTIEATEQSFCNYQYVDALEKSVQPTVHFLVTDIEGVVWYLESVGGTALTGEELLEDGVTYYADNAEGTCSERSSVTVHITNEVSPGQTSQAYLCQDGESVQIWELMTAISNDRPVTTDGAAWRKNSEGRFIEVPTLIDPSDITSGTSYEYRVPAIGACVADTARLTIYIGEPANAGEGGEFEYFSTDLPVNLMDLLGESAQPGGTWDPAIPENGEFDPAFHGAGIFTYTYTVVTSTDVSNTTIGKQIIKCEDSATIEITVIEPVEDERAILCHKGKTLEVDQDAVQAHINHGDTLGECSSTSASKTVVSPNPSRGEFNFSNELTDIYEVRILNFRGGVEKEFKNNGNLNLLEIDLGHLRKGIYFAEVITSNGKEVLRLIKK